MREAFRVFDKNGDGFLDKKEFKRIMTELGDEPLTSEELENLMGKYDEDGDDKISYEGIRYIQYVFTCYRGKTQIYQIKTICD